MTRRRAVGTGDDPVFVSERTAQLDLITGPELQRNLGYRAIGRGPLQQPVAPPDALWAVPEFPLACFALDSLSGTTNRKFERPLIHEPQLTQNVVRRFGLPVAQQ